MQAAAERFDTLNNLLYLDPLFKGQNIPKNVLDNLGRANAGNP